MPVSDVNSAHYTAQCAACAHEKELSRPEVMTGKNPACERCGAAVTIVARLGARQPSGHVVAVQ